MDISHGFIGHTILLSIHYCFILSWYPSLVLGPSFPNSPSVPISLSLSPSLSPSLLHSNQSSSLLASPQQTAWTSFPALCTADLQSTELPALCCALEVREPHKFTVLKWNRGLVWWCSTVIPALGERTRLWAPGKAGLHSKTLSKRKFDYIDKWIDILKVNR